MQSWNFLLNFEVNLGFDQESNYKFYRQQADI